MLQSKVIKKRNYSHSASPDWQYHSQSKKRPPSISPLFFCPHPVLVQWLAALFNSLTQSPITRKRVWSVRVRLRAHLPRNKDSVSGEARASQIQPSIATGESSILSSVSFHCREVAAPRVSKATCKTGNLAENTKTYPTIHQNTQTRTNKYTNTGTPFYFFNPFFLKWHTWLHMRAYLKRPIFKR